MKLDKYSKYFKYIVAFGIIGVIGHFYKKYEDNQENSLDSPNNMYIQKYLLNQSSYLGGKPILWIHNTLNINARNWQSWGSRNTRDLNQNYIYLCIQTIINQCSKDFNICLIDDDSFEKLIPNWRIELSEIPDPIRLHVRALGLMKLLYYYGGLIVPNSFIAFKNLSKLHSNHLKYRDCYVGTFINHNNANLETFPSYKLMGCNKQSKCVKEFINFLERLNSTDYTNETEFLGKIERFLFKGCSENALIQISPKLLGVYDDKKKLMVIDELLSNSFYSFDKDCYGVCLPEEQILKRFKYQWFPRLSHEQLLQSNLTIAKYLLVALNAK